MQKKSHQGKRFAPKLKIKKGDRVVVIAGAHKDRDTVREVLEPCYRRRYEYGQEAHSPNSGQPWWD